MQIRSVRTIVAAVASLIPAGVAAQRPLPAPTLPVVQNTTPLWTDATRWTLSASPTVSIGSVNGPQETMFTAVGAGALTPAGRIVVTDEPSQSVRVFDRSGSFITSMGRPGEGPGEFPPAHLSLTPISEDTVMVVAGLRHPIQLFALSTRNPTVLREHTATINRIVGAGMYTSISAAGGNTIRINSYRDAENTQPPDGRIRATLINVYWATANLSWVMSLGQFPQAEQLKVPSNPPSPNVRVSATFGTVFTPPASPRHFAAADPFGRRLCVGVTTAPRVKCYDRNGGGIEVSWQQSPVRLTPAEVDSWRNSAIQSLSRDSVVKPRAEAIQMLHAVRPERDKPYFGTLHVDADLNLWVENPFKGTTVTGTRVFGVFDARGRYLGDVTIPRTLRIGHIASDRVLGMIDGPDGVPVVVVHELRKG